MRRTFIVLSLVVAVSLGTAATVPTAGATDLAPLHRATGEAVDGSYIVVMEDGRSGHAAARAAGVRVEHRYEHALQGFSARMTDAQVEALRRNPHVAYVEEDQVATVLAAGDPRPAGSDVGTANHNVQYNPPWNLDRIDQRNPPLDGQYRWHQNGAGVDIYVVGTGIQTDHPDFGWRALRGYDAFGGNSEDCNGHSTHMAGIAAGSQHGVAKGAYLWSVRVLDCNGAGSYANLIAGTDWVRQHAASWPTFPAVANYSLGGGYSPALNAAIDNLSNSGVFVAVAAGSSGGDACNFSPSGASQAFTVAASTSSDQAASFSNGGPCVDVYAPGMNITSAWLGGGTRTISGTSTAAPHAAGVAALLKSYGDQSSVAVARWIVTNATPVIGNPPPNTTNRLIYKAGL